MDTKMQILSFFMIFGGLILTFTGFIGAFHFENKRLLSLSFVVIGFYGEALMILGSFIA